MSSAKPQPAPDRETFFDAVLAEVRQNYPQYRAGWSVDSVQTTLTVLEQLPPQIARAAAEMDDEKEHFLEGKVERALREGSVELAAPSGWLYAVISKGRRRVLVPVRRNGGVLSSAA